MKLFIDSANIDDIKKAKKLGLLNGVTTNPSLVKKQAKQMGGDIHDYFDELLRVAKGTPVSLEVTEASAKEMIQEGKNIFFTFNKVAKNVYIKIPVCTSTDGKTNINEGLEAIYSLRKEGIPINATLIFTPEQALLAAKAGASFVSPFVGRIDDIIRKKAKVTFNKTDYFEGKEGYDFLGLENGVHLIEEIVEIFKQHNIRSQVLAASIRNARQLRECARAGADIATVPFSVITDSLTNELTIAGMNQFIKDVVPEYRELGK